MLGRRVPSKPLDENLCRRCQELEPSIVVRTEPLCKGCFSKYVQTKVVKRMESFRVRHSEPGKERSLLLPFSFDASSVALLQILSQHLRGQTEKTGRTGFKLCVLRIVDGNISDDQGDAAYGSLKARHPEHEYHAVPLSDVLALEDICSAFPNIAEDDSKDSAEDRLKRMFSSTKTVTARQDLEVILRQRLIVDVAKKQDCEAVAWADSKTKLAERTLAETAKGRGFALPWVVSDGESPLGISFYYPLSEILNKEIEAYVAFLDPPVDQSLLKPQDKPAVSTKNTTIDDLMSQYFESVERDYPSIVANVVTTARKLTPAALKEVEQQCELCNMPLQGQAPERSRLCYGCIRTIPQID